MRRPSDARAVVTLACVVVACFTDPPLSAEDTGTGAATTTTDASTSSATVVGSSGEAEAGPSTSGSTSVDPDTGGTTEVGADSSTGAMVECGCAEEAAFCEGFESDLDIWDQAVGNPPPQISDEQAVCGVRSMKAEMPPDQTTSTIAVDVPGDPLLAGPFSLGGFVMVDGPCMTDATVRITRLWFDDGGTLPPEYLVELVIQSDELHLRATGIEPSMQPADATTALFPKNTWVAFRIDFDMSDPNAPVIAASIDGTPVLALADPPDLVLLAEPHAFAVLGPRLEMGTLGRDSCVVFYDEVWLAPTP